MNNFKFSRRNLLSLLPMLALPAGMAVANETWPNKPIRMIVGFAAGGPTDSAARFVADGISKELGNLCISRQRMCKHMRAGCGSIPAYAAI